MLVAGVDGCPKGWIAVIASPSGPSLKFEEVAVFSDLASMVALPDIDAIALDIPIGLSDGAPREADIQARQLVKRRRSSVFPAPLRCWLSAEDHVSACDLAFAVTGKRISLQSFNILPKVREADVLMTPKLQSRVRECHPEVSFAVLNDGLPMQNKKTSIAGRIERVALLSALFSQDISMLRIPSGARRDDFYDAAVLAWTASRMAAGNERTLPEFPQLDSRGLRMEIVY